MTTKQPTRKIIRTQAAKPAEVTQTATVQVTEPVYGPFYRKPAREFDTCTGCNSAVLKGFIQASGLCKICDARRLRDVVTSYERTGEASASRELETPDFGHDNDEADTIEAKAKRAHGDAKALKLKDDGTPVNPKAYAKLMMRRAKADAIRDAIEPDSDSLDPMMDTSRTTKGRRLDAAATKIIEQALIREAQAARAKAQIDQLTEAAKTDPVQFMMNKARTSMGLELRAKSNEFQPATDRQKDTLLRIGHAREDIIHANLTVAEASRVLQAGPVWKK